MASVYPMGTTIQVLCTEGLPHLEQNHPGLEKVCRKGRNDGPK
jgi:hypothetical protein